MFSHGSWYLRRILYEDARRTHPHTLASAELVWRGQKMLTDFSGAFVDEPNHCT
jgi:hypothetical protein